MALPLSQRLSPCPLAPPPTGKGSNYGSCVDLFAPGTDILSAAGGADDAQQCVPRRGLCSVCAALQPPTAPCHPQPCLAPPPPCRLRTGTSQSVPFVAGVMALVLQNDSSTTPGNMQRLLSSAAARGRLSEVAGSGRASFAAVRRAGRGAGTGCWCPLLSATTQQPPSPIPRLVQGGTPNLLLQSLVGEPVVVSPPVLGPIDSASAGPWTFTVALTRPPTATVKIHLTIGAGAWLRRAAGLLVRVPYAGLAPASLNREAHFAADLHLPCCPTQLCRLQPRHPGPAQHHVHNQGLEQPP